AVNSVWHRPGVECARAEPKCMICHDILFNQAELALVLAHCPKLATWPNPMLPPTTLYPQLAYRPTVRSRAYGPIRLVPMSKTQRPNFWTTGKGVLTIIGIAVAATAVVMFFVLSTLQN